MILEIGTGKLLTIKQSGPCRHIDSPFGPSFENCKHKEQNQTLIFAILGLKTSLKLRDSIKSKHGYLFA